MRIFAEKCLLVALLLLALVPAARAQKFGWVDSEFIMLKMPEYALAKQELDKVSQTWQKEIEAQKKDIDRLYRNYQAEEVVLTEPMKKKRQDEILLKEKELKEYQNKHFGYEGMLFKKRQEFNKPVQDKVFEAVEKVAKKKQLAVLFDRSGDITMLYTNPAHDYTEFVLEELGLASEDRNQFGERGPVKTVAPPKTPVDPNFESDSGLPEQPGASRAIEKRVNTPSVSTPSKKSTK